VRYAIKEGAIVYPTRPVVGWYVRNEDGPGPALLGYCANSLEIQIEANTLAQLGWERQFRSFWRDMSVLLHPFYGDVRLLGGFELCGGTTYGGESHPVPGSWSGVPNAHAHAIVLGEPYDTRWPALIDRADGRQGLHFLSVPKWNSALRINAIIDDPPTSIAQPIEPDGRASMTYPSDFPFDIEKKDDRFTDRSSKFQAGWRVERREQHFREVRKIKERIAEAVEASPDEASTFSSIICVADIRTT